MVHVIRNYEKPTEAMLQKFREIPAATAYEASGQKGMVDPGEEQLHAAKREVAEETGLTELDYPFGDEHRETVPYSGNKVARYYLAETAEHEIELPVSPELGRPEHHEYRWVTFDEAEHLLPPRLAVVLDWARKTLTGN